MSKFAQWMEIIASSGVIIGIAFLIIEISQNTAATENDAYFAIQSAVADQIMIVAENEAIFEVMTKIYNGEELSENENFRAALYFGSTISLFEYAYSQYQAGIISEELQNSYDDDILLFTHNTDFSKSYWQKSKTGVTEGFRAYVDSLIAKQS